MLVVAAEHSLQGKFAEQCVESVEVAGGRSLSDRNLRSRRQLVERFFLGETLVICGDSCGDITGGLVATQSRGVSIDRFASLVGRGNLG